MLDDAAAAVEVRGLERPDHRPAQAEPVAHQAVDLGGRGDAVAHQAVGLAQQGALQPIEDEAVDLAAEPHRLEPRGAQQGRGRRHHVLGGERRRHQLGDPQQIGRIAGMDDETAGAAGQIGGEGGGRQE